MFPFILGWAGGYLSWTYLAPCPPTCAAQKVKGGGLYGTNRAARRAR